MPRRSEAQTINRWTLVELLGKGANAEVWRARCGGEEVALKILNSADRSRRRTSASATRLRR